MFFQVHRRLCSINSIQHFAEPQRHPFSFTRPTRLTKRACLSLLQKCESTEQLKRIHGRIFRSCLHESRDVMDDFMSFCIAPQSGSLNYAEKVLCSLEEPSIFHYNLVVKAFAKEGRFKKVILLYDRLREDGLLPDNFTYPFVLKSVGCLRALDAGRRAHGFIMRIGLEFDPYIRNSLMEMYAEIGTMEASQLLFDEMRERDLFSWNVLIAGYVKCRMFEEAVSVFEHMEQEGVEPDEASLVSTLSACTRLRNLELGKKIHSYMSGRLKFTIVLGNALLDMYLKCGDLIVGRKFFNQMPIQNVISCTIMVNGYVTRGWLEEAKEIFLASPIKDVVLWTAMINGYVQFNRFEDALCLFREMQTRGLKPDKFTIASLLTICARLGALEQGKWLHGYINENTTNMDVVVGTALVDMYAKCGCMEEAMAIFNTIERKDTAAWTAVICGLAMNGQTSKAIALFLEMKTEGVKPDDITFIGVLSACSHGGLVKEGQKYFNKMQTVHHIAPKLEHYGCLVDLLGRAGLLDEAEKLIETIPCENENDILPFWGALLGACRIHGNVGMSGRVAKRFVKFESHDSGIHTLLANIYAAANRWGDVTRVRKEMKQLGVKKTPGCSSVEVDGSIHEFLVGDTSHPDIARILSVLENMRTALELEEFVDRDELELGILHI